MAGICSSSLHPPCEQGTQRGGVGSPSRNELGLERRLAWDIPADAGAQRGMLGTSTALLVQEMLHSSQFGLQKKLLRAWFVLQQTRVQERGINGAGERI